MTQAAFPGKSGVQTCATQSDAKPQAMTAGIGHNSAAFGMEDEDAPPKALRAIDRDRVEKLLIATRVTAAIFRTAAWRIRGKRKTGDEGRALRRFLIVYARGLGAPVWECAEIFDLNRKQIGQEEAAFLEMLSENEGVDEDADQLTAAVDAAVRVQTGRFLQVSLASLQAEAAAKRAVKRAREAAKLLEPASSPKPVAKKLTEAERIQARIQAERRAEQKAQATRICRAVIAKGEAANATKEQRKKAAEARQALRELGEPLSP